MQGLVALMMAASVGASPLPTASAFGPDWAELPSDREIVDYYPAVAEFLRVGGEVKLRCTLGQNAKLVDCAVEQETPSGWGFGDAVLKVAEGLTAKPALTKTWDSSRPLRFSVSFKPVAPARDLLTPKDEPSPDPDKIELAQRILSAQAPTTEHEGFVAFMLAPLLKGIGDRAVLDRIWPAARAAVESEWLAYQRREAESHARIFSEDELREIAAFMESPAGQAYVGRQQLVVGQAYFNVAQAQNNVVAAVREAYCVDTCPPGEPVTPKRVVSTVVLSPEWLEWPTWADLDAVFPPIAAEMKEGGRATMQCVVSTDGGLEDCVVASEYPPGAGFGEATLQLADKFRMRQRTADGASLAGGSVRIPVVWHPAGPTRPALPSIGGRRPVSKP